AFESAPSLHFAPRQAQLSRRTLGFGTFYDTESPARVDTRSRLATVRDPLVPRVNLMNKLDTQRQKEIQQAEELLFAGAQALGFANGLFQGHFVADWVMPYPRIPAAQQVVLDGALNELHQFLDEHRVPAEIDRKAEIPRS